ncbi:uncharacterized protein LOC141608230 [Silene latifolia]|uniref:uncharacterized protein LOC141608230 n=1 Tax=Silene latifolia TaxID=37657 RepID=UPI003D76C598
MNKIDSICRNFLWSGKDSYARAPNVNWKTCCTPKEEGGLGIKKLKEWNKTLLGNWSWKKIVQVKDSFKVAYVGNQWLNQTKPYNVAAGYQWLRPPATKVQWRFVCWNPLNIPTTSFIYWASKLEILLTTDRIARIGFGQETTCYLCEDGTETHHHLVYDCEFSKQCISIMHKCLSIRFPSQSFDQWCASGRGKSKLQRKVTSACMVGLTYEIWHESNIIRLQQQVCRPDILVSRTITTVKHRWSKNNNSILQQRDKAWMDNLG